MPTNRITITADDQYNPYFIPEGNFDKTIIEEKPHYRSRLYTTDAGNNRLISASAPLFTILSKLNSHAFTGSETDLLQFLIHEVHAFETQSRSANYQPETILAARYVICATIDEVVMSSPWGVKHGWHDYKLLYSFQKAEDQGNRVFAILERITEYPSSYIDLMELIYMSFSFNFKGKFRHELNGDVEISHIIDGLYHQIRHHRKTPRKNLANHVEKLFKQKKARITPKSIWLATSTLALITFLGFNYLLTINKTPLMEEFRSIQTKTIK